jgi:probable rRNA maturation factor
MTPMAEPSPAGATPLTDVVVEDDRWAAIDLPGLSETAAAATLGHLGLAPGDWEISVLGCDDTRIAALNADFRNRPGPTNVLSWPSAERGAHAPGAIPAPPRPGADPGLGDIAIAYDSCAREAAAAGKPLEAHATHLLVHATLHLLGYDHVRDPDATLMEGTEVRILGKLGLSDPY